MSVLSIIFCKKDDACRRALELGIPVVYFANPEQYDAYVSGITTSANQPLSADYIGKKAPLLDVQYQEQWTALLNYYFTTPGLASSTSFQEFLCKFTDNDCSKIDGLDTKALNAIRKAFGLSTWNNELNQYEILQDMKNWWKIFETSWDMKFADGAKKDLWQTYLTAALAVTHRMKLDEWLAEIP